MTFIPIAIFWVLLLLALISRGPLIFILLFCSMSFGSLSVIPPELAQKFSFTPPPIVALAIIFKYGGGANGLSRMLEIALRPAQCLLLFLFWLVTAWVTYFMPRIFAGSVMVIPMRLEQATDGVPLYPTPQNISQLLYLTISIVTVIACALCFRSPTVRQQALVGMCAGGAMIVITGLLDLAGLGPYLDIFRTATYDYLTNVEIADVKRVVGLMPEASTYGSLAVTFLTAIYFFRRAIEAQWIRRIVAPCLVALLIVFSLLSTSSAAYAGLAIFGAIASIEWVWRLFSTREGDIAREGLHVEFWAIVLGFAAIYILYMLVPALFDPFVRLVDTIIFQKTDSDSYRERSMWTAVSFAALIDTWGLGVGMGATRSSNGIVAVFSNCGVLGGLLYYGFMLQTFLRRAPSEIQTDVALLNAVRCYLPPVFILGALAGTSADFGIMNACIYGMAAAVAWPAFSRTAFSAPRSPHPKQKALA